MQKISWKDKITNTEVLLRVNEQKYSWHYTETKMSLPRTSVMVY